MGKDPAISAADAKGELYDVKSVWIGDGSACPTALGANPMITIMALAKRTAGKIAECFRQAGGGMTGIASSSRQISSAVGYQAGPAVQGTTAPLPPVGTVVSHFALIIELDTRPGRAKRTIEVIRDEAIPRLSQPAQGFIDGIVLYALAETDHVTAINF